MFVLFCQNPHISLVILIDQSSLLGVLGVWRNLVYFLQLNYHFPWNLPGVDHEECGGLFSYFVQLLAFEVVVKCHVFHELLKSPFCKHFECLNAIDELFESDHFLVDKRKQKRQILMPINRYQLGSLILFNLVDVDLISVDQLAYSEHLISISDWTF